MKLKIFKLKSVKTSMRSLPGYYQPENPDCTLSFYITYFILAKDRNPLMDQSVAIITIIYRPGWKERYIK